MGSEKPPDKGTVEAELLKKPCGSLGEGLSRQGKQKGQMQWPRGGQALLSHRGCRGQARVVGTE